eukprot:gene11880-14531_t
MDHEEFAAVSGFVHRAVHDLDAAEMRALEIAQEFIVVAGDVEDARALAALAQEFLHDVVVLLRPVPAAAQTPSIDDVADQIDRIRIVILQKVQEKGRLGAFGTKMHIGQKERAKLTCLWLNHEADLRSAPVRIGTSGLTET